MFAFEAATMLRHTFVLLVLSQFAFDVDAIFLPYWSKRNHTNSSFHIPKSALALDGLGKRFGKKLSYYTDLASNYTLDERCAKGLSVSIAWHPYSPYATVYPTKYRGEAGLTVDGMFPGILNSIIAGCCHENTEVSFGKLLKSVRHAENHIEEDLFDFNFPLYGYDTSAETFRQVKMLMI